MIAYKQTFLTYFTCKGYAASSNRPLPKMQNELYGQDIYIIGSGPSMKNIDLTMLNGKNIIFLNNAVSIYDDIECSKSYVIISDFLRTIELRPGIIARGIPGIVTTDKLFSKRVQPTACSSPFLFLMPRFDCVRENRGSKLQISTAFGFSEDITTGVYL